MDDIEATIVTLTVGNDTHTPHVATTGNHCDSASIEVDKFSDLSGLNIDLDSIVDLDGRVGVADGAGVVGDEIRDTLGTELHALDLGELVGCFGLGDAVDGEAALGVVDETEVLAGLFDCDYVHEAGGVGGICADLAVDLDEALHDDRLDFPVSCSGSARRKRKRGEVPGIQGILEPIPDEYHKWQTVPQLVRTW